MMEVEGKNNRKQRIIESNAQLRQQIEQEMELHPQQDMDLDRQMRKKIEVFFQALRYGIVAIQTIKTEDLEQYRAGINKYFPRQQLHKNAILIELTSRSRARTSKQPQPPTLFERAQNWWISINTILFLFLSIIIAGGYTLLQLSIVDNWVTILGYICIGCLTVFSIITSFASFWPRRHLREFKYLQSD